MFKKKKSRKKTGRINDPSISLNGAGRIYTVSLAYWKPIIAFIFRDELSIVVSKLKLSGFDSISLPPFFERIDHMSPVSCSPAPPAGSQRSRPRKEVPPCPKCARFPDLWTSCLHCLCLWPVWSCGTRRVTLLLLTFFLPLQGSVYETSNLDRGGSNRKKKIEEFSRSSREKLVQSKNKMFSKFTSILQHAVEAVSL